MLLISLISTLIVWSNVPNVADFLDWVLKWISLANFYSLLGHL